MLLKVVNIRSVDFIFRERAVISYLLVIDILIETVLVNDTELANRMDRRELRACELADGHVLVRRSYFQTFFD